MKLRRSIPTRGDRKSMIVTGKAPGKPKKRCLSCGQLSKIRLCPGCAELQRVLIERFSMPPGGSHPR